MYYRTFWFLVWIVWYGKRKNENDIQNESDSYMSRLWQPILEKIRIFGNHSGCHQIPERSFFYRGKQFPVCARCTGVLLGQTIALILGILRVYVNYGVSFVLLLVMGFDWFIQEIRIKESTNIRRFITGFMGGFGLFCIYINVLHKAFKVVSIYLRSKV